MATVLRWLLIASIAIAGVDAAANGEAARLIDRLQADASLVSATQFDLSNLRTAVVSLVQLAVLLTTVGFLIAWTSRSYRNLPALGVEGLRFTPGWAVGAWFVPFLNLVRPKQILDDTWRASDPSDGRPWRDHPVTPLLHWWWGLWILASLLSYTSFSEPADLAESQSRAVRGAVADVVLAAACSLALLLVTRLTDRQEARASRTALSRSRRWLYATWAVSSAAVVVFGLAFAGFAAVDDAAAEQKPSNGASATSDSAAHSTLATDLALGDCFNEPSDANTSNEKFTLLAVNVVPCDQSHDEEVIGYIAYPAGPDVAFPGDDALTTRADEECVTAFEDWVGRPLAESSLEMGYLWPLQDSWDVGERGILCVAYRTGGSRLVGSVRNTAL